MRRMPWWARARSLKGAILLACGVLLLAACNDGDDAPTPDVGDEPDAASFAALGAEGLEQTYRLVLVMESADGAVGEVVLAQSPPQRSIRYERGEETAFIVLPGDGSGIICGEPDTTCVQLAADRAFEAEGVLSPFLGGLTVFRELEEVPGYEFRGRTELAGRSAVCASWTPPFAGEGVFEQCLDEMTGIVLAWTFEAPDDGRVSFEAAEVGDPDGSDFEPTGPVQELS